VKYYFQRLPAHALIAASLAGLSFLVLKETSVVRYMSHSLLFRICFFWTCCGTIFGSAWITGRTERKKHLRGTALLSNEDFSHLVEGDGIAIPNTASERKANKYLRIKKEDESKHFLICGDTGAGKSALFHYFAEQIQRRPDHLSVFYDPKLEFWKYHGCPQRGDILLYPFSDGCPYWDLASEITRPEMAKLIAESLLPCKPGLENDFFVKSPRNILEKLLKKMHRERTSIEEFLSWLSVEGTIDKILEGDAAANFIPKDAPAQRAGVLGGLSDVASYLELLPSSVGRKRFSLAEWVQKRNGWLFIAAGGTADQRILQPLISIWFNILMQQLLDLSPDATPPPTWVYIDEIASLQTLSFLEQAASQARSYNTRLVLGFQNKYQIETYYDKLAQPILSAPKTKIFLRTAEIDSAEWVARMLGEPEFEQKVVSNSSQLMGNKHESLSYRKERKTEYLVLPSEFLSLGDREGFLQYQGLVTPIEFEYPQLTTRNQVLRKDTN